MKVLIDANVLFPTVLREIVTGYAATGGFEPLWSARILEEWARAAARLGEEEIARGEIATLRARFPLAEVEVDERDVEGLSLPDQDDRHVLAAAIAGHADELLTQNLRDFPTRTLSRYGVVRRDPDGFLREAWEGDDARLGSVVEEVLARAKAFGIEGDQKAVLKRARLPRLAKAIASER